METIFHNFQINAPIQNVFKAISTPAGFNDWWTLRCEGKPELNEIFNFYFGDEYNWFAEITKYEVNKEIEFKITKASEEWLPTSFGFLLQEEANDSTFVQFYHKNWTEASNEFKISTYCWGSLLRDLKNYLEKGIITPFEQRN